VIPGPTNSLTDVAGVRVGHHSRVGDGWLTGVTVVLAPPDGAVAGVDVRGGGPGTHETDVLDPRNLVERAHAVLLGGGSAFGLAAAAGVMDRLADAGIGFPVGAPGQVVPIVPAAVIFDLGRGGEFRATPDATFGAAAVDAASDGRVIQGTVGAGTGAVTGGVLKGGVGSASTVLDGVTVGALAVVNAAGSTVDPAGRLYSAALGLPGEFDWLQDPVEAPPVPGGGLPLHTTLGVVATDATLTKAQCQKLAGIAHDGMARAIRPVHTMFDGDTIFALATCAGPAPDPMVLHGLLAAAADTFSRAVAHAMLAATGAAGFLAYGEAFPSALARRR
jgi:L-aminopeptidase/D-esterase-like protein